MSEMTNPLQPPYVQPTPQQIIIPQSWREWRALVWSELIMRKMNVRRETAAAIVVAVSVLLFVIINTIWQLQKVGAL